VGEGCEISGGLEVYRIERHLQKAIFGDVFSAAGLSSGRSFAIKVLDRDMVQRFSDLQLDDDQFCESPLCEVRYAEMMRGLDNVVQLEDHFSDVSSHFIVSNLAEGGDLLDALRLRPGGFEEQQARAAIRGAALGLASLHQRGLAMQDVSLENMLVYVLGDDDWSIGVCDPGQACPFVVDPRSGEEVPAAFHGFVAKEFRPPELYEKKEYLASKVDSWCLGWSTFYLLVAQPLFHSADPSEPDPDYIMFQTKPSKLFSFKGWNPNLSPQAEDFIHQLMRVDPQERLSVLDALRHPWLAEAAPSASAPRVSAVAGASCRPDGAAWKPLPPQSASVKDDESRPSSAGSRAPSAAPDSRATTAAPTPTGARRPGPTLLQHASQCLKEPILPIVSKEGKAARGGAQRAGQLPGSRAVSH